MPDKDMHEGLPVQGYRPQDQKRVDMANECKVLEEQTLRLLEKLAERLDTDHRHLALAKTNIQQGFMWAVRSIFQPSRINLPGDAEMGNDK